MTHTVIPVFHHIKTLPSWFQDFHWIHFHVEPRRRSAALIHETYIDTVPGIGLDNDDARGVMIDGLRLCLWNSPAPRWHLSKYVSLSKWLTKAVRQS